jgi:hypothetical protein
MIIIKFLIKLFNSTTVGILYIKTECHKRGLPVSGNKAVLEERLAVFD